MLNFIFCQGFGQDAKIELEQFVRNEFADGNLTLKVVKNQWDKPPKELPTDQNGKILNPNTLSESKLTPDVELKKVGSIRLHFEYSNSSLYIQPPENSILPQIKIDLESSKAHINGLELSEAKGMNIDHSKNLFRSPWNGFQWNSVESDGKEKRLNLMLQKGTAT